MSIAEDEEEAKSGSRLPVAPMKIKVLVSGTTYLSLLAGMLIISAPLALNETESWHSWTPEAERFGIYLLSSGDLVISNDDIVCYNLTSHEIVLGKSGVARIKELGTIPVNGTGFVVMVDGEAVYTGAFWTPVSSISYHGVVIMIEIPLPDTLRLELGYPDPSFYEGSDPRGDTRIADVFRALSKLIH